MRVIRLMETQKKHEPKALAIALILAAAWLSVSLAACKSRPEATREWQPSDHVQPQQDDPARTPAPAAPEEGGADRAADALFSVSCANCHGRDGRGLGEQRPPGAQMPNFADPAFQAQRTDAQLKAAIQTGRGMMPAFGKQLNDQGIDVLVNRVRRFGKTGTP
jgi:mono/diheme cytochrome c family protein